MIKQIIFLICALSVHTLDVQASSFEQYAQGNMENYTHKAEKQEKRAILTEGAAIGLKAGAFMAELAGYEIFALPGLFLALGTAGEAYHVGQDAKKMEEVSERFRAALKSVQAQGGKNSFLLKANPALDIEKIFSSSAKKSCKKSCNANQGRKSSNNMEKISWCVLNCPPVILTDYMCEVFGNKELVGGNSFIPKLTQLFADPFVSVYRKHLQARMINRYYRAEFFLSLVGQLSRFTTLAHRLEYADFWSPEAESDPTLIIHSLRTDAPLIQDIQKCFGELCYTTQAEYEHEDARSLKPEYYKKYDILRQMAGRKDIPQSGLISLEEMAKTVPKGSVNASSFPAPFKNYCSYYFARTPIDFHSRLRNLAKLQSYKTYFNKKVTDRYETIKRSNAATESFIKAFDADVLLREEERLSRDVKELSQNSRELMDHKDRLASFMTSFSEFVEASSKEGDTALQTWQRNNPEKYKMVIAFLDHKMQTE